MRSKLVLSVALVGATAPRAAAEPPEIDLAALGLDPASSSFDDHLNIYGFADFTWQYMRWSRPSAYVHDVTSFTFGNLDIYLAKNLMAKARTLAEVRFLFAPNGSQNADGSVVDTTSQDLADFDRPVQWGGIVIERAYVEYDVHPLLTARVGHWLTPYGIWNIDHGSPAIISTTRPFIIGEQFFPEHQTGLELLGGTRVGDFKLGYHATLSNGRGPTEAQLDADNEPAYGARLELETPWAVKLGASVYTGHAVETTGGVSSSIDEFSYGADAQWDRGGLHLQGELIGRHRHYLTSAEAPLAATASTDARDFGAYVLAGYRFDRVWNAMPYAFYEYYHPHHDPSFDLVSDLNLGVNFRPAPSFVVKVQLTLPYFRDPDADRLLAGEHLRMVSMQTAWVF